MGLRTHRWSTPGLYLALYATRTAPPVSFACISAPVWRVYGAQRCNGLYVLGAMHEVRLLPLPFSVFRGKEMLIMIRWP